MQYRLLTLTFLFLANYSFAQQADTLRRKDANGWEFVQVRSFRQVVLEGNLHNGIKEGIWTEYLPTEYPANITSYINGKKVGTAVGFDGIGRVVYIENYKDDKLEGPKKVYDPQKGGLRTEVVYYSEGKKHGNYTKWYENGKIQENGNYVYDLRDGLSAWYFGNGNKSVEYNYRNGKLDGNASTFFENGKVSAYGTYKNDKQSGDWKEYYEDGNMQAEGMYKDGEKEGPWKQYDTDGKLVKTVTYKKGEIKK